MIPSIDREKCNRCETCVHVCPSGVIEMESGGGIPVFTDSWDELCISCGHCVAVCPEAALYMQSMRPEDCPPLKKELFVCEEQVEQLIKSRRSIRAYRKKQVDQSLLKRLIDIARYAPTAKNRQPVHWLVIENRDKIDRLASIVVQWMRSMADENDGAIFPVRLMKEIVADWENGMDRICRGAPHLIVAYGTKGLGAALSGSLIALTTLELAAPPFGLGACWAGYFNIAANSYPPMGKSLGLPEGHQCYGAMMIGYPKYLYHRIPLRKAPPITWR